MIDLLINFINVSRPHSLGKSHTNLGTMSPKGFLPSERDKGGWDEILFHEEKNMKCSFAELGAKI